MVKCRWTNRGEERDSSELLTFRLLNCAEHQGCGPTPWRSVAASALLKLLSKNGRSCARSGQLERLVGWCLVEFQPKIRSSICSSEGTLPVSTKWHSSRDKSL